MTYVIEDNVPLPDKRGAGNAVETALTHALRTMEIGQSFFCHDRTPAQINGTRQRVSRDMGRKFSIRTEGVGCRVWRIS